MYRKIIICILSIIIIPSLFIGFVVLSYSESYSKFIFNRQIERDNRMKELIYLKREYDDVYDIGIKFKDGRIIGGTVRPSIYRFRKLTMIDNYRIYYMSSDGVYFSGLSDSYLEMMLHKPFRYFDTDLNKYIDCYDEIKLLVEKIYHEGPIPGRKDKKDIQDWGDEEELKKYTGYYTSEDIFEYRSKWISKEELERLREYNRKNGWREKIYIEYMDRAE